MPPTAPPLVVMIWADTAESTDIIATVVTNAGMWKAEASREFSSEQPTPTAMMTSSMSTKLCVALYTMTPIVALKSVAAPKLISKEPKV